MADAASPGPNRAPGELRMGKTIAKFAAAWGVVSFYFRSDVPHRAYNGVIDAMYRILSGFPSASYLVEHAIKDSFGILGAAFFVTLFVATGLAPLGAAARMIARARIRAGHGDLLDRVRAWTAAHPSPTRALLATPGALLVLRFSWPGAYELRHLGELAACVPADLLAAWGVYATAKRGLRALLAPTLDGSRAATRFEIRADEIVFDAVAVTREAKGAIAGVAAMSVVVAGLLASRPIVSLFHDRWPFYLMAAYVALTALTAVVFQRASRVAVGVDGVHVRGTSRARFFAYRDIDEARSNGGDVELVRRGEVVVRLQLHGEDAVRRDAVLSRIQEHVARVKEGRGAIAAQLVASSSKEALARVANGGADYRVASLTREQLWALVEGPEIDASARKAAAEALTRSSGEGERVRLRVAAEHCAEPHVRVALEEIARGEGDAGDGSLGRRAVR